MNVATAFAQLRSLVSTRVEFKSTDKGGYGKAVERLLGLSASSATCDLVDGEIKTVTVTAQPTETVAVGMISAAAIAQPFYQSKYWLKMRNVIFVPLKRDDTSFTILQPLLLRLDDRADIRDQIAKDYDLIATATAGKTIDSSVGAIIQSRTKGAAGSSTRAFYYRRPFLAGLLNTTVSQWNTPGYSVGVGTGGILAPRGKQHPPGYAYKIRDIVGVNVPMWIDPFVGDAAVLLELVAIGVIGPDTRVVIGDIDESVCKLFTAVKNEHTELLLSHGNIGNPRLSRLARLLKTADHKVIVGLSLWLRSVTIFHGDYKDCIREYDCGIGVVYLDPPHAPDGAYVGPAVGRFAEPPRPKGKFYQAEFFSFVKQHNRGVGMVLVSGSTSVTSICGLLHLKIVRLYTCKLVGRKSQDRAVEILAYSTL